MHCCLLNNVQNRNNDLKLRREKDSKTAVRVTKRIHQTVSGCVGGTTVSKSEMRQAELKINIVGTAPCLQQLAPSTFTITTANVH